MARSVLASKDVHDHIYIIYIYTVYNIYYVIIS